MYPYRRINTYRTQHRGWFSAVLPWMFIAAAVAGTMLPLRHWAHWPAPASTQAARDSETIWKRAGNPDVRRPPSWLVRGCQPLIQIKKAARFFASLNPGQADQCDTTTVVPTETRW